MVELVNFALVDGDIVIRTHAEGKLAAAPRFDYPVPGPDPFGTPADECQASGPVLRF